MLDFSHDESELNTDYFRFKGYSNRLTFNELAAQVFIFYAAGFEPPSLLSTFTLYEVSVHKEIQRRVQEECDRVLRASGGKITYEGIQVRYNFQRGIFSPVRTSFDFSYG